MWRTSRTGFPRPSTRSAAVVTVESSTLSTVTGNFVGASNSVTKESGSAWPMSLSVASNLVVMVYSERLRRGSRLQLFVEPGERLVLYLLPEHVRRVVKAAAE